MGAALWELDRQGEAQPPPDVLDNLFRLQKELVFQLIEEMGVELTAEQRAAIEDVPTQNLQAFLAYSRGLIAEDTGNFEAAARFFRQASQLDPDFEAAARQAETADNLSRVGGSTDRARAAATQADGPQTPSVSSMDERFRTLDSQIKSNFVPGQDNRNGPQEAVSTQLPPPPEPPSRK
jgi:tetratricopeptide (TPR) repeat protein